LLLLLNLMLLYLFVKNETKNLFLKYLSGYLYTFPENEVYLNFYLYYFIYIICYVFGKSLESFQVELCHLDINPTISSTPNKKSFIFSLPSKTISSRSTPNAAPATWPIDGSTLSNSSSIFTFSFLSFM